MLIASYNIQWGTGKDGRVDLDRIAGDLGGAEVIALQEVDRFWTRSGMTDQATEIARRFPEHHWVYGPAMDLDADGDDTAGRVAHRRRQFGNMVLSRHPILSTRTHPLPKLNLPEALSLHRSALEAVIARPTGPLRVYSVHLGHGAAAERIGQIERLREIVDTAPREGGAWTGRRYAPVWALDSQQPPMPEPAIVLGDFNCTPDSAEYRRMVAAGDLFDAWSMAGTGDAAGWTCQVDSGPVRIDYAFLSPDLQGKARAMRVDHQAQGSDHQPIWLDLDL